MLAFYGKRLFNNMSGDVEILCYFSGIVRHCVIPLNHMYRSLQ